MAMAVHESPDMAKLWAVPVQKGTPQGSPPGSTPTNTSVLFSSEFDDVYLAEFRAHRQWRQHAAPAGTVDGRKKVRVLLTGTRARVHRRRRPSPTVTSTFCPVQQYKKPRTEIGRVELPTFGKGIGRADEAVVVEPWIVALPMVGTPLWRDGSAADVVDPLLIVQRLPQPFEPPASPVNAVLEKELRLLFDQMAMSGDVVYRFRAGPAPGLEHIECCDVLTEWALQLVRKCAGDGVWRLRVERLVYKVLFEYIMKLQFGGKHGNVGRICGPMDVGEGTDVYEIQPEEGPLLDMLMWLKEVAKDPYGSMMSGISHEWQNMNVNLCNQQNLGQGCPSGLNLNEPPCEVRCQDDFTVCQNMVICAREALFMKIKNIFPIEDFPYRTSKKQKIQHYLQGTYRTTATISSDNMDSSLDDQSRPGNGLASSHGMLNQPQRRSPRAFALLKFSDFQRKRVPVGPAFQADVPEWKGPSCKTVLSGDDEDSNDSMQSGTQIWPIKCDFQEAGLETTGKGRPDFCVCPSPRSVSCVRYHISKSRLQLKWNLGQAFNDLGFSDMGEEVSNSWTLDEQRIFDALVKLNPLSEDKTFLDPALKLFGSKSSQDIVSYYFNVFVLRRMGIQTRLIGGDADSDDDDFNVHAYEDLYPRVLHRRIIKNS